MSCPFTLDGSQCTLTDRNHQDLHYIRPGIRFTDLQSDQKKAA